MKSTLIRKRSLRGKKWVPLAEKTMTTEEYFPETVSEVKAGSWVKLKDLGDIYHGFVIRVDKHKFSIFWWCNDEDHYIHFMDGYTKVNIDQQLRFFKSNER